MSPGLHTLRRMATEGVLPVLATALAERRFRFRRALALSHLKRLGREGEQVPTFDPDTEPPPGWRIWSPRLGRTGREFLAHLDHPDRLPGFTRAQRAERLARWHADCPDEEEDCIREARALTRGDFSAFVPGCPLMPDGVRWRVMVGAQGEWPAISVADYLNLDTDYTLPADPRPTWELNRLLHLPTLAGAYLATQERVFLDTLTAHIESWINQNPPGIGFTWLQPIEMGLRASALSFAYVLVGDAQPLPDTFRLRWLALIQRLASLTDRSLGDSPVTHNHLVTEAATLAVVGRLLPELDRADRWKTRGLRILRREAEKQVYPSGLHGELALSYHFFVMESFLWGLAAQGMAGEETDPVLTETVGRMALAGERLLRGDGFCWRVGDNDDARALRVPGSVTQRREGMTALAFALAGMEREGISSERVWLGPLGAPSPSSDTTRTHRPLVSFADAGIASLEHDETRLLFVAGATHVRPGVAQNHRHADCLSVVLEDRGVVILDDPGVHRYSPDLETRARDRRTRAHNAPCVDDGDCLEVSSHRFGVGPTPTVSAFSARWDGVLARFSARHTGYGEALPLQRDLLAAPGRFLVTVDRLGARDGTPHRLSAGFLTPWRWEAAGDGAIIRKDSHALARFVCLSPDFTMMLDDPDEADGAGLSPRYGQRVEASRLRVTRTVWGEGALVCALLLDPSRHDASPTLEEDAAGLWFCLDGTRFSLSNPGV